MGKRLSAQYLHSSLDAGRYYDDAGTGLHIYVRKSGSKSWSQKLRFRGRQIELGLGSYPAVTLAEARRKALNPHKWNVKSPGLMPGDLVWQNPR